jgi:hypothetical protein
LGTPDPSSSVMLPAYLGYGVLDRDSVHAADGAIKATYSDEHGIVYSVSADDVSCTLTSSWRGKWLAVHRGGTLNEAFFASWRDSEALWDDDRFVELGFEVAALGNVFVVYARLAFVYYPAALLCALRLSIPSANRLAWQSFKATLDPDTPEPRLGIERETPGQIVHERLNETRWSEPVLVVDLVVPLAVVRQAVSRCVRAGIVAADRRYRLVVSPYALGCWQPGDPDQDERRFAVLHRDERPPG